MDIFHNSVSTNKVLIIDDDDLFRKILKKRVAEFLAPNSVEFIAAKTLCEARETLNKCPTDSNTTFDLVIIDQNLPDGLGSEFLAEQRSLPNTLEHIPIILMSSDESPEIPGSAIRSGATYFLPKSLISEPFVKSLILGIIDAKKVRNELIETQIHLGIIDSVKTLVATLKHEINNPLGAVFGAIYLLKDENISKEDRENFIKLLDESSKRIKGVVDKIIQMIETTKIQKSKIKPSGTLKL